MCKLPVNKVSGMRYVCNKATGWLMVTETLGDVRGKANTWAMRKPNKSSKPRAIKDKRLQRLWPSFQTTSYSGTPTDASAAQERKPHTYNITQSHNNNSATHPMFVSTNIEYYKQNSVRNSKIIQLWLFLSSWFVVLYCSDSQPGELNPLRGHKIKLRGREMMNVLVYLWECERTVRKTNLLGLF